MQNAFVRLVLLTLAVTISYLRRKFGISIADFLLDKILLLLFMGWDAVTVIYHLPATLKKHSQALFRALAVIFWVSGVGGICGLMGFGCYNFCRERTTEGQLEAIEWSCSRHLGESYAETNGTGTDVHCPADPSKEWGKAGEPAVYFHVAFKTQAGERFIGASPSYRTALVDLAALKPGHWYKLKYANCDYRHAASWWEKPQK